MLTPRNPWPAGRRIVQWIGFTALALTGGLIWAQDDQVPSAADVPPILKVGSPAPDFNLLGIDGKRHTLKDYAAAKVLAIVFTCDHCPVAQMYEKRIKQLTSDYKDRGVDVVAIMGNDPKAIHLSELGHTDLSDSYPEMKLRAAYRHLNYPYLYDGDTQAVALKYGPTATPHIYIFDEKRILRYEGRIDNNSREELMTKHEARDAIEALLAGKPVAITDTPAVGCSTKWAYKEKGARAEVEGNNEKPVTVDLVSADQLKTLRQNSGTNKLLLMNFWATWCGPCTAEFPELQKMVRQYAKRALNVVTVSINAPDEKKFVLDFLNEQHAINQNLLWSTNDVEDAVKAFGNDWSGGVPFTVLIGMNGEVLYKTQGEMNPVEVKRVILKNLPDDRYIGQHAYWNSTF
ncbi:MAG: redoxin domain-containing protein [Acidobacteriaceae bacterium]|nr:redoxin domain-containing protein [Acidobacteriaceae bacterium]